MPDETTRTVTVDGVTWKRQFDGVWGAPNPPGPPDGEEWDVWFNAQHDHAMDRIAALEAEREEIERALKQLYDEDGDANEFGPFASTALAALLAWYREAQGGI